MDDSTETESRENQNDQKETLDLLENKKGYVNVRKLEKLDEAFKKVAKDRKSFTDLDKVQDPLQKAKLEYEIKQSPYKGSVSFSRYNREFYHPKSPSDEFEILFSSYAMIVIMAFAVFLMATIIEISVTLVTSTCYTFGQYVLLDKSHNNEITASDKIASYFLFALSCSFFAILAGVCVIFLSPQSEGSGLPDVKSYLNGWHIEGLFSMRALIGKSIGCALAIGSGLIAGDKNKFTKKCH